MQPSSRKTRPFKTGVRNKANRRTRERALTARKSWMRLLRFHLCLQNDLIYSSATCRFGSWYAWSLASSLARAPRKRLSHWEFLSGSQVNAPIAILIWLMIYPMVLKIDFGGLKGVAQRPKGLFVT